MPYLLKGNCVHKKNADGSAGEVVKCHPTREKATAHLRALYKNVPDAQQHSEFFVPFSRYDFADTKAKEKKKPYGDVKYADPKNGKYPIDTEAHVRAAWSYINMPKNAAKYPLNGVTASQVKARIRAAAKKLGIQIG